MVEAMVATDLLHTEDINITSALARVFSIAKNHNQLAIGATEVTKILYRITSPEDSQPLKLVILAKDLIKEYQDLIVPKCEQFGIPIIFLEDRVELGSITPMKIKKAGAIGIKNFICETREKAFIINAIKKQ